MIILGVDPGYRNLGLCLMQVSASGYDVIWSETVTLGSDKQPQTAFPKKLLPLLERLHLEYNIEGVASESPPYIMRQIKTSCLLWFASGLLVSWAYSNGIPYKHAAPITLKKACAKVLGIPWNRKFMPTKAQVKQSIVRLTGAGSRTSHENDAALAALTLYTDAIPR